MSPLYGQRVAVLEARRSSELANLIGRLGGTAVCAPALREVSGDAAPAARELLDGLGDGSIDLVILLTGVAVQQVFDAAAALGRDGELVARLNAATLVCRGPKPTAVLRRSGLRPQVVAASPYTNADMISALGDLPLTGRGVALLHYGERNAPLANYLAGRGARLRELSVYEWQLPEDHTLLVDLAQSILRGQIDAIAITSQIQLRHLLRIADLLGQREALVAALNAIVVAAVGPTCAAALREAGVAVAVMPENPFMGQMVNDLAGYFNLVAQA
ncbi:MAG TPA: uroporphyrinogen-III synthase [Herpetosiphonaceae bacterium]|nr:uroporphyrinogen-III synthase [Herpetosiphonaceae bacterium]